MIISVCSRRAIERVSERNVKTDEYVSVYVCMCLGEWMSFLMCICILKGRLYMNEVSWYHALLTGFHFYASLVTST